MSRTPILILGALLVAGTAIYWKNSGLPSIGGVITQQVENVREVARQEPDPFGRSRAETARPIHFQCPEPNLSPSKKNQRRFPPLTGIAGMSLEPSQNRR